MNAVAFRSEGHPYGCSIACGVLQPGEATHSGAQERLSRKDTDGLWIWSDVPDEGQIFQALRSGKPIASVDGAQMLVLHPRHEERWDKCEATVYWGAVEALYAAEPDAPPLAELLPVMDHIRKKVSKPLDESLIKRIREEVRVQVLPLLALGDSADTRDSLRVLAEQFIHFGVLPEHITRLLPGADLQAMLYTARLASPRDRRAAVAALPLVGLPDLLG